MVNTDLTKLFILLVEKFQDDLKREEVMALTLAIDLVSTKGNNEFKELYGTFMVDHLGRAISKLLRIYHEDDGGVLQHGHRV